MRVLTVDGEFEDVRLREWPLASVGKFPQRIDQGNRLIPLINSADGEPRAATYATIYKTNPWVWSAVNQIARGLARLPLKVFALSPEGDPQRIRGDLNTGPGRPSGGEHLDRLLTRPAPNVSRHQFLYSTATDLLTFGNALWVLERDATGVRSLWHVPWTQVTVHTGTEVPIVSYEVRADLGTQSKFFVPEDVVHFGIGSDPTSPIGQSPLQPLRSTLALYDALQRHLTNYFRNAARPSGHLKVSPATGPDAIARIREQVERAYTSPENAGRLLVSSGEWQTVGESPEHSSVIDLIRESRVEVLAAFGVPPPLVGILDRAIMSNVRELRVHYLRDVVGPWADRIEADVNAQLIPRSNSWSGLYVSFDLDEHLAPDLEARAQAYAQSSRWLAINEVRRRENLPPIDDPAANAVYVPMNEQAVGVDVTGEPETTLPDEPGGQE